MTLADAMDKENTFTTRDSRPMGHLLMLCVKQATRRGGLHCGMKTCAELLKTDHASVMFCVLPASCEQLGMQIHHTLIKAFCHEKNIPIFPVRDERHLSALIRKVSAKSRGCKVKGDVGDMNCVLVQYPGKGISKFDKELVQYYNQYMMGGMPVPSMDMPA